MTRNLRMDANQIHAEAIARHRHYEKHGRKLPSKWERFRRSWPQDDGKQERIRDPHAAELVRRAMIGRFI